MNSYIMVRRLPGPAYLLLVGVLALLNQADILSWGESWPLFLILAGVLLLAERAALATGGYPQTPYPGQPYTGPAAGTASNPGSSLEVAPHVEMTSFTQDSGDEHKGGQL
ncbi:MAG: hypothetical protein ABSB60_05605 [Terracidiphilus sp.]|jgi:hypothetical protein